MKDQNKTKKQLITELQEMRRRLVKIEPESATDILLQGEDKYRVLLDESADPIFSLDSNGKYHYVNRAFADGVGMKVQQIIGNKIWDVFHKKEADKRFNALNGVFQTGIEKVVEVRVPHHENDRFYITTITPIKDVQGNVSSVICISKNITDRKWTEDELKKSEERFRLIAESTNDVFYEWNVGTNELKWFGDIDGVLKYNKGEVKHTLQAWIEKIHPNDQPSLDDAVKLHRESTEQINYQYRVICKDGSVRVWRDHAKPILDNKGKPVRWVGGVSDITENKQTENKLTDQKQRLDYILQGTNVGTWEWNVQTGETIYSERWAEIIGHTLKELSPVSVDTLTKFLHPEDLKKSDRLLKECFEGRSEYYHCECRMKHKNGKWVWVLDRGMIATWTEDGKPEWMYGTHQNITDRKQAEELLRNEKKFIEMLIDSLPGIFYLFTKDGKFLLWNQNFEKVSGYTVEEISAMHTRDFFPVEEQALVESRISEVFSKGESFVEANWLSKDGTKTPFYLTGVCIDFEGTLCQVGMGIDLSDQKRAEQEKLKLKEQLQQAQKMEAIGTLAGGIAHDFNNILGAIMGYTELSMSNVQGQKKVIKNLQEVMNASERAKEMVQQILAFSRKNEQTMMSVNIGKIIRGTSGFLRSTIPTTIEIRLKIDKGLGQILGNATQINQVLMNLCTNATHAMRKDGGVLEINLKGVILDKKSTLSLDIKPGIYQKLTVSDTGTGMSQEIVERIFDPYFTTKDVGEGTGMGLAVIYGIIKSHKGEIKVFSKLRQGTVFDVYFPVLEIVGAEIIPVEEQPDFRGNNERVLFVDDEAILVDLGVQILENLGYQVDSSTDSIETLKIFKDDPDKYDLIITDMTMPKMTGLKLIKEIHKVRPHIPVILCTGYSNEINKTNYLDSGISAFVYKPVNSSELSRVIRNVLDKKV